MYEALEATKSILTSTLETESQDELVRFQVVAFSPLPLRKPLNPPAGTATLVKKLKESKILKIHHVFHEQDRLHQCLSYLFDVEAYAILNSVERSVLEPCYKKLEDDMETKDQNTRVLEDLKTLIVAKLKIARTKASGGSGAELEHLEDYLDKLAKHPNLQQSFETCRTTIPSAVALAPINWQTVRLPGGSDDAMTISGYRYTTMYVVMFDSHNDAIAEPEGLICGVSERVALCGTLEACLLIGRRTATQHILHSNLKRSHSNLSMVTQQCLQDLIGKQLPEYSDIKQASVLCNQRDKKKKEEEVEKDKKEEEDQAGRPSKVLITGTNLGLLRADDFQVRFLREGQETGAPDVIPLCPPESLRHKGFLRPRIFGNDGERASVEFDDVAGIGIVARTRKGAPSILLRIQDAIDAITTTREIDARLSWTSNGTASNLDPLTLVATSFCKAALEILALGLVASDSLLNQDLYSNNPRSLKTLRALNQLAVKLEVEEDWTELYSSFLSREKFRPTLYADLPSHPLIRKMATQLKSKFATVEKSLALQSAAKGKWYSFAEVSVVWTAHSSMIAWDFVAGRMIDRATRDHVNQAYIRLISQLKEHSESGMEGHAVAEDIEQAFGLCTIKPASTEIFRTINSDILKPLLELRHACNRLVVISLAG